MTLSQRSPSGFVQRRLVAHPRVGRRYKPDLERVRFLSYYFLLGEYSVSVTTMNRLKPAEGPERARGERRDLAASPQRLQRTSGAKVSG